MLITFSNSNSFKLEALADIQDLEANVTIEEEKHLIAFIKQWLSDQEWFTFHTSGSTGPPKTIKLHRKTIRYSAEQTLNALGLNNNEEIVRSLLCISPKFIGGAMVFVRAWLTKGQLKIVPANTDFDDLEGSYELTSIVPIQVEKLIQKPSSLQKLENVLIGGAPLATSTETRLVKKLAEKQQWYATYGMTETASHVALRKVGNSVFHATGDVQFELDDRGCLNLYGSITENKTVQTNDIVNLLSPTSFEWMGRFDFIINTGGIKVNPERIEAKISSLFSLDELVITWIPDVRLGQKVVCLSTTPFDLTSITGDDLHPYEQPKQLAIYNELPKTANGKIDRKACQQLAEGLLT